MPEEDRPVKAPDTLRRYYRMDPRKIVLVKSLLDGHEGILVQRTVDPAQGIVELLVSPDFEPDVENLVSALCRSLWMEPVPAPKPRPPSPPAPGAPEPAPSSPIPADPEDDPETR